VADLARNTTPERKSVSGVAQVPKAEAEAEAEATAAATAAAAAAVG
jgi:hypothetical protein